jgi:hypothetical protein
MLDQHLLMTIENFVLYVTCGRFFQIRVPPEIEMLSMTFFCDRSRVGVNQCGFQGSFLACDPVEEITVSPLSTCKRKRPSTRRLLRRKVRYLVPFFQPEPNTRVLHSVDTCNFEYCYEGFS